VTALSQYDHQALNAYDPDIVLEGDLESGQIGNFSQSANAYKFLARSVGIVVLQHLQQIGAERQMSGASRVPASVFADEFYNFAYEGFVDGVNKLRDAGISLLLSHQSWSDLERVSETFAKGVWDNTRNKIIFFSNDQSFCEHVSSSVGTKVGTELTVRRGTDGYLNQVSMLEASQREVDQFLLHPNQIKSLKIGQAYLIQAGIGGTSSPAGTSTRVTGTNLVMLPPLPEAERPSPKSPSSETEGLRLYAQFVLGEIL